MSVARIKGFTLVELMITLVILSIAASMAVPSYLNFTRNNQIQAKAEETFRLLQYARGEAVANRVKVEVRVANGQWNVWSRAADRNTLTSTRRLEYDAAQAQLRTSTLTNNRIVFNPNGSATATNITVCRGSDAASGYRIQVRPSGAVSLYNRGRSDITGTSLASCTP